MTVMCLGLTAAEVEGIAEVDAVEHVIDYDESIGSSKSMNSPEHIFQCIVWSHNDDVNSRSVSRTFLLYHNILTAKFRYCLCHKF